MMGLIMDTLESGTFNEIVGLVILSVVVISFTIIIFIMSLRR